MKKVCERKFLIIFILPHKKYFGKFRKLHIFNKNNIFVVSTLNVSFARVKKVLPLVKDPGGGDTRRMRHMLECRLGVFLCVRGIWLIQRKNLSFLAQSLRNDK